VAPGLKKGRKIKPEDVLSILQIYEQLRKKRKKKSKENSRPKSAIGNAIKIPKENRG
jgi:hypothetical protein